MRPLPLRSLFCLRVGPRASTALLLLISAACGGRGDDASASPGVSARGPVVARVDGAAIGLDDVREVVEQTGLSPREALLRLEDEILLAKEAGLRGYQRSSAVEEQGRRALVQALLAQTIEREVVLEKIPLTEVRARFDDVAQRAGISPDSFPSHETAIRQQLMLERRKAALDELLSQLRASSKVQLHESKVGKLLADPALWGGSS